MNADKEDELRDKFAAAALTGILSGIDEPNCEECAEIAYEMADKMLDERKKWALKDELDDILCG